MPGDSLSTWGDTRARATAIVEGLPLYDLCRRDLAEWCQVGLKDLGLVGPFLESLEKYLQEYPFYASLTSDVEDASRTSVTYLDVPSVANELGVTQGYLRKVLCEMPTSLPFGSFTERRSWRIHPLDVPVIRSAFAGVSRDGHSKSKV